MWRREYPSLSVNHTRVSRHVVDTQAGGREGGVTVTLKWGGLGLVFDVERRGSPVGG